MRSSYIKVFTLALLLAGFGVSRVQAGYILRVFYDGIPGTNVADLTSAPSFPNGPNPNGSPLQGEYLTDLFEGLSSSGYPPASNGAENYGSRTRGYVEAPVTGNYTFWIASADSSELWLSTSTDPAAKKKIASVNGAVGFRNWTAQTSQKSAAVALQAGQKYYIEALHKAGKGKDYLSVGWTLPDNTVQRPMLSLYLQAYADPALPDPSFVRPPESQTVPEHTVATFYADVNATFPVSYIWLKNGIPIPGATLSSYSTFANLADSGTIYNLIAGNGRGVIISDPAVLTVVPDVTAPKLVSASSTFTNPVTVKVTFSEAVDPATATVPQLYVLDGQQSVTAAVMGENDSTVYLSTTPLAYNTPHTLSAFGIVDQATTPNPIDSSVTVSFTIPIQIIYKLYDGIGGTSTNDILSNTKFKSGAFDRFLWNSTIFSSPSWGSGDNYIGQLQGILIPPTTGEYTFYVYSDDGSLLYLSSDDQPANKVVIAGFDGWTNEREYTKYPGQKSAPITLQAGTRYYIEADVKEGGGGDGVGVAWLKPGQTSIVSGDASYVIPIANLDYFGPSGAVSIGGQPETATVVEGSPATFAATGISGLPPYAFQWYRNGVEIPGATSSSYTSPKLTLTDAQDKFYVVIKNAFSTVTSSEAGVVITPDTEGPTLVGAGSLTMNTVSLPFSESVDPVSAVLADNYSLQALDGTSVNITSITMVDDSTVTLVTADLIFGTQYIVSVKDVKDTSVAGNVMAPTTASFKPFNFIGTARIGNTQPYGAVALGETVTVQGGGADIWGTSDGLAFVYKQVTGDFDFSIRLESVERSDDWAKAGLMARSTLDANSRHVFNAGTPGAGTINGLTMQYRPTTGGDSSDAPSVRITAQYPNAWLRLQRIGAVFYCYYSTDGVNWVQHNKLDSSTSSEGAMPSTLYFGFAVTSHTTAATTHAVLSDFQVPAKVPFSIESQPQSATVLQGGTVTLTVGYKGTPPITFQWQRNGINVAGATSASYTTPALTYTNDNGAVYRCLITSIMEGKTTTSAEATITVPSDTVPPSITSVTSAVTLDQVKITFSEAVDPATVDDDNFKIDGGLVVLNALLASPNQVVLTTTPQTPGTKYLLTVNAIKDLVGWSLAGGNQKSFTAFVFVTPLVVFEIYDDIGGGTTVPDLRNSDKFKAHKPDRMLVLNSTETSWENGSNLGGRLFTLFTPTITDDYVFYVCSDDSSELWISTDADPANLLSAPIAKVDGWTNSREWTKYASQKSAPIHLEQGKQYYIEALMKEGGGGDGVGIAAVAMGSLPEVTAQGENPPNETADKAFDKTTSTKWLDFANVAAGTVNVKINFQDSTSEGFAGYLADKSEVFGDRGNGYSYGWNIDNTANARNRNNADKTLAPDERYDSFTHMQKPGGPYIWEIELPNDTYKVHIVGGEPNNFDSTIKLMAEDVLVVDGTPCTTDSRFREGSALVTVTDGRLTVSVATNAVNAKIAFMEISNGTSPRASWIQYLYGTGPKVVTKYTITSANDAPERDPKDWTFYGVNADGSFTLLDTQVGQTFSARFAKNSYPIVNEFAYVGYRLEISSVANPITANSVQLAEIELLDAQGNNTVESTFGNNAAPIDGQHTGLYVNPDLSNITITQQPTDVTLLENRKATFTVAATGYSQYTKGVNFQWQRDGENIAGATGASYTTPLLTLADSGAKFQCVMTVPALTQISSAATLTVQKDSAPPVASSAAGMTGNGQINIFFDELVDQATAEEVGNYGVLGGIVVDAMLAKDGKSVILTSQFVTNTTVQVAVGGIKDLAGNVMPVTMLTATMFSWTSRDVGTQDPTTFEFTNPLEPGYGLIYNKGDFDVVAGGTDIWDASDGFHFVYQQRTGDFDLAVQVTRLDMANNWSKAGLMVREKLTGNSRNISAVVDPSAGANLYEANYRSTEGGASAGWPSGTTGGAGVPYPNAWLRLQRVGNWFVAYRSTDGANWTIYARDVIDFPRPVYLGMAVTSHDNSAGKTTVAEFRNLQDVPAGPLTIATPPADTKVLQGQTATFTVGASGSQPYFYQWFKNGAAINGATAASYTTPSLTYASDNGAQFICVVSNLNKQVLTSTAATLSIDPDFVKPTVSSVAGTILFNQIVVTYSEAVQDASATNLGNYTVTGGLTLQSAKLSADKLSVTLGTPVQTAGTSYSVTIKNVKDKAGNVMDDAQKSFTAFVFLQGYLIREYYADIGGGTTVADLTNNANFIAGKPTSVSAITDKFQTPTDVADNYGQKVYGLLIPPLTGNYTFYISSDDASALYLSTDDSPAHKSATPIATVASWTSSLQWTKEANQKSAPIALQAGKMYYVEALMKEGGGGDNLAVGAQPPGDTSVVVDGAAPISSAYFGVFVNPDHSQITITKQPQDVQVVQNRNATFSVEATAVSDVTTVPSYQWQKNGADIAGATQSSYSALANLADNGAKFTCVISVPLKSVTSQAATLTVQADTVAPKALSAAGLVGNGEVYVYFDEILDPVSASTAANYGVSGATVDDASLSTDGKSVILTVTGMAGTNANVAVNKIKDLTGNPMAQAVILAAPLSSLTAIDVGVQDPVTLQFTDPVERGATWARNAVDFDVIAGGSDYWGGPDGFHFAYETRTGDFDIKVQVASMERRDNWTHASLMVRETLGNFSRYINAVTDPSAAQSGANVWEMNYRPTANAGSANVPNYTAVGPLNYPNVWVRLQRVGNDFTGYRSTDGVTWTKMATVNQTYPATVYVGMATTAHNNGAGQATFVQYRNYGNYKP
jgi:regulation of enolase protein 1 (concanavalin A-like superfamily)